MATRSRIGIELSDGSILSAYHHWDGYPQWLGRILNTHYNSREQAAELIDGGDMSCAWTKDRWTGKKVAEYVTRMLKLRNMVLNTILNVVKIALLVLTILSNSICLMVKNMLTSSAMVSGCAMI